MHTNTSDKPVYHFVTLIIWSSLQLTICSREFVRFGPVLLLKMKIKPVQLLQNLWRPTFAHESLAYETPQHIGAVMTVRWFVKSLFHEKMPMSSVIIVWVSACRAVRPLHSLPSTDRHLGFRF